MLRRVFLIAALVLAVSPAAAQAPTPPNDAEEAGKVFPYLANYLKLPSADRSRWTLAYYFQIGGKPSSDLQLWIQDGATRVPLSLNAEGRAERLPTLTQLETKRIVNFNQPESAKISVNMSPELSLRPAVEISAAELAAGIAQAAAGARKAAPMAVRMMVPNFDRVTLPGAEGAEVVLADGRTAVLPTSKRGTPYFRPADHPGARMVRFKTPPRRLPVGAA